MAEVIQLSGIQTSGNNGQARVTEKGKEGEPASTFDALLQLIGQQEGKDGELIPAEIQSIQLPILQQNIVIVPVLQEKTTIPAVEQSQGELPTLKQSMGSTAAGQMVETKPEYTSLNRLSTLPLAQGATKLAKEIVNSDVSDPIIPNLDTSEKTGDLKQHVLLAGTSKSHISLETGKEQNLTAFQMKLSEDSNQTESPNTNQTGQLQLPNEFSLINHTTTDQPTLDGKTVLTETVRAAHFEQDMKQFIQPAIHVTGSDEGFEAVFTLAPKHLGKVDVKVTIQDGQVTAEFLTSTSLGKDLLETHVQALRSSLETQGLQVGKIDISQQPSNTNTNTNFVGTFSQSGDSHGRQGQQESRKRSDQHLIQAKEQTRAYDIQTDWVSQINTTA
ncbi:flagellar hook-length control protein FliK [Neobacillus kokaensis]|uniref:Flagellar hook-length control protein-like C-terminal domain-containing protein n=1 Tax=Neobacillus kokaensis TaxID=2759023 RepID=A0ABQ3N8S5_9BACI|nr:flagellar hook-length control protein FliK [Neobacillus kokaensis]GHH99987.1 hypothetical protein AM1BK_35300 [Neobacillus kokaensis]